MTVGEIVGEGLVIGGCRDAQLLKQKVAQMLELVGLRPEYSDRYSHEFSGGQRQRIGIARAVIMEPKLLIADEPISALDVSVQAQIINLLEDLRQEMGLTILFVAHDLAVVKYFCTRIGVMCQGQLVEVAPPAELFGNPLHPYTRSLLSAIPLPDPRAQRRRVRIPYEPGETSDTHLCQIEPNHWVRTPIHPAN
jgi:ABC-type oligopeptide transport system ATPase subunit